MDLQAIGRILLVGGIIAAVIGGLLLLAARIPFLQNLGNLPGDIRIEGQGFTCLFPIATMIILSVVLTIVINVVIRLINRP